MLVLNLACDAGHGFEGWFGSASDFDSQQQRGLLTCPLCNSATVKRMPSAPRLNLSGAAEPAAAPPSPPPPHGSAGSPSPAPNFGSMTPALAIDLQRQALQAVRQLVANTEDVGAAFPEEARRIHYGESAQRGIRGQATPDEARQLSEEGIEVLALPLLPALKEPQQ